MTMKALIIGACLVLTPTLAFAQRMPTQYNTYPSGQLEQSRHNFFFGTGPGTMSANRMAIRNGTLKLAPNSTPPTFSKSGVLISPGVLTGNHAHTAHGHH